MRMQKIWLQPSKMNGSNKCAPSEMYIGRLASLFTLATKFIALRLPTNVTRTLGLILVKAFHHLSVGSAWG